MGQGEGSGVTCARQVCTRAGCTQQTAHLRMRRFGVIWQRIVLIVRRLSSCLVPSLPLSDMGRAHCSRNTSSSVLADRIRRDQCLSSSRLAEARRWVTDSSSGPKRSASCSASVSWRPLSLPACSPSRMPSCRPFFQPYSFQLSDSWFMCRFSCGYSRAYRCCTVVLGFR